MLAQLDLREYLLGNRLWFNSTYTTALGHGWPPSEIVIHIEVSNEDRISTPPCTCRIGTRSEYMARSKYKWKDMNWWQALRDWDRSHYITIATHDDGRSYLLPMKLPGPECVVPEIYTCIILSGYELDY
jgi:hypothetical protein